MVGSHSLPTAAASFTDRASLLQEFVGLMRFAPGWNLYSQPSRPASDHTATVRAPSSWTTHYDITVTERAEVVNRGACLTQLLTLVRFRYQPPGGQLWMQTRVR